MAQTPQPPGPDPIVIYLIAEQYHRASSILINNPIDVKTTIFPTVICQAFALELFLKCLLFIEHGRTFPQHNFKDLFEKLSAATQAKIRTHFEPHLQQAQQHIATHGKPGLKVDFDFILETAQNIFTKLRYAYEGIPPMTGWGAYGILLAARQVILDLYPDWEMKLLELNMPMQVFHHL